MCKGSEEGKETGFGYFNNICKKFNQKINMKLEVLSWAGLKLPQQKNTKFLKM